MRGRGEAKAEVSDLDKENVVEEGKHEFHRPREGGVDNPPEKVMQAGLNLGGGAEWQ